MDTVAPDGHGCHVCGNHLERWFDLDDEPVALLECVSCLSVTTGPDLLDMPFPISGGSK